VVGWKGVDKMQVEDALPIDGMGCRERKKREEKKRETDIGRISWHGCCW
jgi:hypothetical protein